jgi:hypothetical protein
VTATGPAAALAAAQQKLYDVFGPVPQPEWAGECPRCAGPRGDGGPPEGRHPPEGPRRPEDPWPPESRHHAEDPGQPASPGRPEDRCRLAGPAATIAAADLAVCAQRLLRPRVPAGELRYLLPRLLECAVSDPVAFPDPEVVSGQLARASWRKWPGQEPRAVHEFLAAWWEVTLREYPATHPAGTVLCSIAATGAPLRAFLAAWGRLETTAAVRHLYDLLATDVHWVPRMRLTNAFWNPGSASYRQVLGWLAGGPAARAAEAAFSRCDSDPTRDLLATIHGWITLSDLHHPPPARMLSGAEADDFLSRVQARATREISKRFARARAEARARGKEPFDQVALAGFCAAARPGGGAPPAGQWAGFEEMYYVSYPDVMTLREFAGKVSGSRVRPLRPGPSPGKARSIPGPSQGLSAPYQDRISPVPAGTATVAWSQLPGGTPG